MAYFRGNIHVPRYDDDHYRRQLALERNRRQQEELRRRDALLQQIAYQEALVRRHFQEQNTDEHIRQNYKEEADIDPAYQIVRGPDGRLYRVVRRLETPPSSSTPQTVERGTGTDESFHRTQNGRDGHSSTEGNASKTSKLFSFGAGVTNTAMKERVVEVQKRLQATRQPYGHHESKANVLIVEDASDSEYEDENALDVTLRNRRPSPGEWMEPVDIKL